MHTWWQYQTALSLLTPSRKDMISNISAVKEEEKTQKIVSSLHLLDCFTNIFFKSFVQIVTACSTSEIIQNEVMNSVPASSGGRPSSRVPEAAQAIPWSCKPDGKVRVLNPDISKQCINMSRKVNASWYGKKYSLTSIVGGLDKCDRTKSYRTKTGQVIYLIQIPLQWYS